MQALEELRQAGLDAEGIDGLQKLYSEVRAEEDRGKEAQNQGPGSEGGAEPPRPSQRGAPLKLGGLATGVISRLLTTLKLIYDVSRPLSKSLEVMNVASLGCSAWGLTAWRPA